MSNETKFTPPPWNVSTWIEQPNNRTKPMVAAGGVTVAITHPAPICQQDECGANAHLIAAAPELYEALDKLKSSYEALAHDYEYAVGAGDIHPLHAEHIQRCAAALAKARGEQQ